MLIRWKKLYFPPSTHAPSLKACFPTGEPPLHLFLMPFSPPAKVGHHLGDVLTHILPLYPVKSFIPKNQTIEGLHINKQGSGAKNNAYNSKQDFYCQQF